MNPIHILYVEDNDYLREMLGEILQNDQRKVSLCASAEEALTAMRNQRFDVLVTDVSLPGLSGTDLARLALGMRADQWVVLCSGYEFKLGLNDFGPNVRSLSKPFEPEELDALMDEITASLQKLK